MLSKTTTLIATVIVVLMAIGCQSKNLSHADELRLLTPEQEKQLLAQAERVEPQAVVKRYIKSPKGVVVGTVSSQTTIIFLKSGGGHFSVNTTCTSTCSGIPVNICPTGSNACGCDSKCTTCAGCSDSSGCTGTCSSTKVGFGNFGRFIA